ncbi:tetratricopeptide repeat protein [Marivirga sp. S37H4]|uniref:Tetratricopeptide repeat protein n=1 Tax=Marivirga aurantiaca TaxID=2802615 RepID=A0A934X0X6_9BACT|nr:tetratricopeptide repeat protein [Marivirga aurantiaca]MBK6266311.1 tetratricopeptide repeat protein [Marivirga aurantiaca]
MIFTFVILLLALSGNAQDKDKEEDTDSLKVAYEIATARDIHRNNHNDSLESIHAEKAIKIALEAGDTLLYAQALDNMGLLYRYHQQYEEAINLHGKAFNLVIDKADVPPLSKMIYANNAGVASRYAQQLDKAVLYYKEALKIAEEENDLKNIAISCNGLGNTFLYIPNRENDALTYFKRALEASKAQGNKLGVAMNYLSISDFYNKQEEYLEARSYLNELLALNTERKDTFGLAITYEFFGLNYYEEDKDLQKSEMYYLKSLELFQNLNNSHKEADVFFHLGDVSRKNKNFKQAINYYNKSWELAKEINNKGLLEEIAYWLSYVYEQQSNYPKSLEYYKISQQYKDSVAMKEQETQIAAIEKRFALEKKESQIALLEKDKVLKETQLINQEETLRSQNFFLLLLISGLIAIILIAMLQYRNIKIKKKSNLLLKEQNSKILYQKEEIEKVNKQLEIALEEIIDQQKKNEERRIKLIESKFENKIQSLTLQSLESQMNPHFLFNGMNAVRWLVIQNKNDKAMKYLDTFANLLRLSLTSNRKNVIELGEELRTTSLYLEIEKLRFDSEFNFSVNIEEGINVDKVMVPPKILQPLAENAVKHGLLPSRKANKELSINVINTPEGVTIEVIDNGMGFRLRSNQENESRPDGTHLGLKLIEERLSIYNQQNDNSITFKIAPNYDGHDQLTGTRAEISIATKKIGEEVDLNV